MKVLFSGIFKRLGIQHNGKQFPTFHRISANLGKCLHNVFKYESTKSMESEEILNRGVARNFLRGDKRGVWGRKFPSGVQGQSTAVRVWRRSPQKPETHAEYSTEQSHRSSQIAYCSESDYTLNKFPATTGGHAPMPPPLGYATYTECVLCYDGQKSSNVNVDAFCDVNNNIINCIGYQYHAILMSSH